MNGADAVVDVDGVKRMANVSFVPNPAVGDYVLLHAGFAIRKWSEEDVKEYRAIMSEIAHEFQPRD